VVFSVVVLTLLLAGAACCLLTLDRVAAAALVVISAVWLPANNGHLEGATVVVVSRTHGITVADLLGVAAWLIGTGILVAAELPSRSRYSRNPNRALAVFAGCVGVFVAGAAVAVATG
jgi:hypothetical protein